MQPSNNNCATKGKITTGRPRLVLTRESQRRKNNNRIAKLTNYYYHSSHGVVNKTNHDCYEGHNDDIILFVDYDIIKFLNCNE